MARDFLSPLDYRIREEIMNNLNTLKEAHNYSQKDIVEGTGLSQGLISHYLLGRRTPTQSNMKKIADFFNVDVGDIDPRQKKAHTNTVNVNGSEVGFLGENSGTITFNNKKDKADRLHDAVVENLGFADIGLEQTDVNIHQLLLDYHRQLTNNTSTINTSVADLSTLLKMVINRQDKALMKQEEMIMLLRVLINKMD